jgi:uncharacterized protein YndB with AHSA1/START domain/DNA-binding transcriptional ArsR family regulator
VAQDDVFVALSNPVRRRLLEVLAQGPRSAGSLAGLFDLSRPAVAEHLQVLRRAGLVRDEAVGRHRHYHLTADPLADVSEWVHPFERFWRSRLRTLADLVEENPMTNIDADIATISVDQFIAASPAKVWKALTDPELHGRWWAPGDIAAIPGHRFHLDMPGWGSIPCEVIEVEPERRLVYTLNQDWTLAWQLTPQDQGTLLHLDHSGFDLTDHKGRDAFERMGPGWRDNVLPGLARLAADLPD